MRTISTIALRAVAGGLQALAPALPVVAIVAAFGTVLYTMGFILTRVLSTELQFVYTQLMVPVLEKFDLEVYRNLDEIGRGLGRWPRFRKLSCVYGFLGGPVFDTGGIADDIAAIFTEWNPIKAVNGLFGLGENILNYLDDLSEVILGRRISDLANDAADVVLLMLDTILNGSGEDLAALIEVEVGDYGEAMDAVAASIDTLIESPYEELDNYLEESIAFAAGIRTDLVLAVQTEEVICGQAAYRVNLTDEGFTEFYDSVIEDYTDTIMVDSREVEVGYVPIRRHKLRLTAKAIAGARRKDFWVVTNDRGQFNVELPLDFRVEKITVQTRVASSDYYSVYGKLPSWDVFQTECNLPRSEVENFWDFSIVDKDGDSYKEFEFIYEGVSVSEPFEYVAKYEPVDKFEWDSAGTILLAVRNARFMYLDMAIKMVDVFCFTDTEKSYPKTQYYIVTKDDDLTDIQYDSASKTITQDLNKRWWHGYFDVNNLKPSALYVLFRMLLVAELVYNGRMDAFQSELKDVLNNESIYAFYGGNTANAAFTIAWIWYMQMLILDDSTANSQRFDIDGEIDPTYLDLNIYSAKLLAKIFRELQLAYDLQVLQTVRSSMAFNEIDSLQTGFAYLAHLKHHIESESLDLAPFNQIVSEYLQFSGDKAFSCPLSGTFIDQVCLDYNQKNPGIDVFDFKNYVGANTKIRWKSLVQNPRTTAMYNLWELAERPSREIGFARIFLEYNRVKPLTAGLSPNQMYRYFVVSKNHLHQWYKTNNLVGIRGAYISGYAQFKLMVLKKGQRFSLESGKLWGDQYGVIHDDQGMYPLVVPFMNQAGDSSAVYTFVVSTPSSESTCFWFLDVSQTPEGSLYDVDGKEYFRDLCQDANNNPNQDQAEFPVD